MANTTKYLQTLSTGQAINKEPTARTLEPVNPPILDQLVETLSRYSGLSTATILILVVLWKQVGEPLKDKFITPRISNLTRSYRVTQKIKDRVQALRGKVDSHRTILFEVNKKNNSIILICQELSDGGIANIDMAYKQKEAECVKHIWERFVDNDFICREVNLIEKPLYRGYLLESGIYFVIYQRVLIDKDKTFILAFHYRYEGHVSFITAQELRLEIKEQADAIASLLLQNLPINDTSK